MTGRYPESFATIGTWARDNGFAVEEARVRFAQYVVLQAIASSRTLAGMLVFKGGNALDFIWHPNRSTVDLDFSADLSDGSQALTEERLGELLSPALRAATTRFGGLFALHRVRQDPRGIDKSFVTYQARIGYALPNERMLILRLREGRTSPRVIPVEVSVNEVICADEQFLIGDSRSLRVSTLEDILAEKLRALLPQPLRDRLRRQDLLDIAVVL